MKPQLYDPLTRSALTFVTATHKLLHRVTRGRIGKRFPGGGYVVWLTVTGRRSGEPRTVPLLGIRDGDGPDATWVVTGSNAGQTKAPAWVYNVRADPNGHLEVDGAKFAIRAEEVADPDERARLYRMLTGYWKSYASYARRTSREIPVFRLHRAG
jgi:F420H(2)-dependent quinone reductase